MWCDVMWCVLPLYYCWIGAKRIFTLLEVLTFDACALMLLLYSSTRSVVYCMAWHGRLFVFAIYFFIFLYLLFILFCLLPPSTILVPGFAWLRDRFWRWPHVWEIKKKTSCLDCCPVVGLCWWRVSSLLPLFIIIHTYYTHDMGVRIWWSFYARPQLGSSVVCYHCCLFACFFARSFVLAWITVFFIFFFCHKRK